MLIAQLSLGIIISVATADVIADSKLQNSSAALQECNCGEFSTKCSLIGGTKYCDCLKGYAEEYGICSPCFCGVFEIACYLFGGEKNCNCKDGYNDRFGTCTECFCGAHAKSCGFELVSGDKYCNCEDGYAHIYGICVECNCGKNSTCRFRDEVKTCSCQEGDAERLGTCTRCDCGPDTSCSFTSSGEKKCPGTPWLRSPFAIVCIVALAGVVIFAGSFVAYRKLRR